MSKDHEAVTTLKGKFGEERVIYFPCDITKTEDFKEIFKQIVRVLNGLDILINNAGLQNDNLVEQTFNINVIALIRGSLMALDYMGKHNGSKGGTIVNVASTAGIVPSPELSVYSASKFAVVAFGRNLEAFYNKTNVRILTLCPGLTKTKLAMDISTNTVLDFVDEEMVQSINTFTKQPCTHVANAAIDLIQKGENGTIMVVKNNEPPFAIKIPLYVCK
ncbi:alcohol dehydrogenase 1-like isoform X2 [Odontomachus brunneus]|nr:alcohol dehydrogenase 1-like isoform X2 [Odontomachus brunneus]